MTELNIVDEIAEILAIPISDISVTERQQILALINKEKAKANKEWFKAGYDKGLYDGNQLPVNFEMLRHSMDKLTTQLNSIEAQLTKEGGQMIDERETEAYKKGFIDGGLSFVKKAKHSSKEDV